MDITKFDISRRADLEGNPVEFLVEVEGGSVSRVFQLHMEAPPTIAGLVASLHGAAVAIERAIAKEAGSV